MIGKFEGDECPKCKTTTKYVSDKRCVKCKLSTIKKSPSKIIIGKDDYEIPPYLSLTASETTGFSQNMSRSKCGILINKG